MAGYNHFPHCTCEFCENARRGWVSHGSHHAGGKLGSNWVSWRRPLQATADYVIPNARCPACGVPVFFYQSPAGGRVFFDELGPPWPKHPCMDTPERARWKPLNEEYPRVVPPSPPAWKASGWIPLRITAVTPAAGKIQVKGDEVDTSRKVSLYIPPTSQLQIGNIAFVQNTKYPGVRKISFFPDQGNYSSSSPQILLCLEAPYFLVPWDVLRDAFRGNPDAQNSVGYDTSFAWRDLDEKRGSNGPYFFASVRWSIPVHWFTTAANGGDLTALHNLGVIHETGYAAAEGLCTDPRKAFSFYRAACRGRLPLTLRHLADCFDEGLGTPLRPCRAAYLRALADRLAEQGDDKAA